MQDDLNVQDETKQALHAALKDSTGWTFKDDKWTVANLSSGREIKCVCEGTDVVVSYGDTKGNDVSAKGADLMQALMNFRTALAVKFNFSLENDLKAAVPVPTGP